MEDMMTAQNTALVVVDMQNGFLNEKSRHIIPSVVNLVEQMSNRDVPVLFTKFQNKPCSQYERLIGWQRLRESPEIDLTPELSTFAREVFVKNFYSAFTDAFSQRVQEAGWTNLVLCGVATDGCVLKTAIDAFERDLTPFIVADACASHAGQAVHDAGLLLAGRFIGKPQIVTTEAILERVDRG